jgi:hypothetical protein
LTAFFVAGFGARFAARAKLASRSFRSLSSFGVDVFKTLPPDGAASLRQ